MNSMKFAFVGLVVAFSSLAHATGPNDCLVQANAAADQIFQQIIDDAPMAVEFSPLIKIINGAQVTTGSGTGNVFYKYSTSGEYEMTRGDAPIYRSNIWLILNTNCVVVSSHSRDVFERYDNGQ